MIGVKKHEFLLCPIWAEGMTKAVICMNCFGIGYYDESMGTILGIKEGCSV